MTTTLAQSTVDDAPTRSIDQVGAVVVGCNDGAALIVTLESLQSSIEHIVYVDLGSTDGSQRCAKKLGVHVLELDESVEVSLAHARNEGVVALATLNPDVRFVQILDGGCVMARGWIDAALDHILADSTIAAVFGRRKERFPRATIYKQLRDMEWEDREGPTDHCSGDALLRIAALREINGYNADVIAGAESELCVRMRAAGWSIHRLALDMTYHDAELTRFRHWWRESRRAGHAYAQGYEIHGRGPQGFCRDEMRSLQIWGGVVPAVAVLLAPLTFGISLVAALTLYVRLFLKIRNDREESGSQPRDATVYAIFGVLGKLPQFSGALTYIWNRANGRSSRLK